MDTEIRNYLQAIPDERRERIVVLINFVAKNFPNAKLKMWYRMPAFKSSSGGWAAIAAQKHHDSLYTCAAHHIEPYFQKHPKTKHGKGCLNFKLGEHIDFEALQEVISSALGHIHTHSSKQQ